MELRAEMRAMDEDTSGQEAVEIMTGGSKAGSRGEKIRIEQHSISGMVWFGGWLFSLGFLHLSFWKGVLALVVWPYYLGVSLSSLA